MYDLEEQEQIEAVKSWWKQYQRWVMGALLVSLLAAAGYQGWHYYQQRAVREAGKLFEAVRVAARQGEAPSTLKAAQQLENSQPGSALASRGALIAAAVCQVRGQPADALNQLTWVEQHSKESSLADLARLREAGILADQKQYDQALRQLDLNQKSDFAALTLDLRGDILIAMGRLPEARLAYQGAVDQSPPMDALHQLAETKWEALGGKK